MNKEMHDLCIEYSELRSITSTLIVVSGSDLITITKGKFIKAARKHLKEIHKNFQFSAEKLFAKLVEYEILRETGKTFHNAMEYDYIFGNDNRNFWLYDRKQREIDKIIYHHNNG